MSAKPTDREMVSRSRAPRAGGPRLLDLRGLRCPLPALKVRKALRGLPAGELLTAVCDDPLAAIDVPNVVREDGHALVEASGGETLTFVILRAQSPPEDR